MNELELEQQEQERLERYLKTAKLMLSLKDHDGVKILLDVLEKRVAGIKEALSENNKYLNEEGKELFAQKKVYKWFIRIFTTAERRAEVINNELDGREQKDSIEYN